MKWQSHFMGIRVNLYGVLPLNESFAQVRNEECWKHQTGTLLSMKPSGIDLFIISVSLR